MKNVYTRMDVLSKIVCFYKTINKGGHIPVTAFGIIMTLRPRS